MAPRSNKNKNNTKVKKVSSSSSASSSGSASGSASAPAASYLALLPNPKFKYVCGVVSNCGSTCKNKKKNGLTTCLFHSNDDQYLCGHLTLNKTKCRSLKGKCIHHDKIESPKRESVQCISTTVDGHRCQNLTLSNSQICKLHLINDELLCNYQHTKSGIPCKSKKVPSKSYCSIHNEIANADTGAYPDSYSNSDTVSLPIPGSAGGI